MSPAEPSRPAWATSLDESHVRRVCNLVRQELRARGLEARIDDKGAHWALSDGSTHGIPLAALAAACAGSEPATWSAMIADRVDRLLASGSFESTTPDAPPPVPAPPRPDSAPTEMPSAGVPTPEPRALVSTSRPRAEPLMTDPPALLPPVVPAPPPVAAPLAAAPQLPPGRAQPRGKGGRGTSIVSVGLVAGVGLSLGLDLWGAWEWGTAEASRVAVGASNDVLLEATPVGQVDVYAEADGRYLGRPPLRFLIPDDSQLGVVLTAPGRTPRRIELPSSGQIAVELQPRLPTSRKCEVQLSGSPGWTFEALEGGNLEPDTGRLEVDQAAVVLVHPAGYGAYVIDCPDDGQPSERYLVRQMRAEPVSVQVAEPEGALIALAGEPIGAAPIEWMQSAMFAQVALEAGENSRWRWVAAPSPMEVTMPSDHGAPRTQIPGTKVAPPPPPPGVNPDGAGRPPAPSR